MKLSQKLRRLQTVDLIEVLAIAGLIHLPSHRFPDNSRGLVDGLNHIGYPAHHRKSAHSGDQRVQPWISLQYRLGHLVLFQIIACFLAIQQDCRIEAKELKFLILLLQLFPEAQQYGQFICAGFYGIKIITNITAVYLIQQTQLISFHTPNHTA